MHSKRVGIAVDRQKFRCKNCSRVFYEQLPDMDDKRSATKRLVAYIEKQSLKRPHASIAEEVGVDEKTVRNIFRDYVNRLEKNLQIELPQWLGIDEIHIIGKPRCVLTNIEKRTLIDILPKRDKATLVYYLIKLPNKNRVQYVCMDMWEPYRSAIQAVMPQARIIIDKFHVLRMANQALETVRKDTRAGLTQKERRTLMHDRHILLKRKNDLDARELLILEYWIKNFENLGAAYELKETFYGLWESKNKLEAAEKYREWQSRLPENIKYAYQPLLTALTNWEKEIFSYFDHKITNAYTESLNNLIRALNRLGRGYSFENLRAKVLFTEGVRKTSRPKYQKQDFMKNMIMDAKQGFPFLESEYMDYGVDILVLMQKIENGEID